MMDRKTLFTYLSNLHTPERMTLAGECQHRMCDVLIRGRNKHGTEGTKNGVGPLDFLAEGSTVIATISSCC